jgi:hypothetical protein
MFICSQIESLDLEYGEDAYEFFFADHWWLQIPV